ncbi:DUF2946 family protein [Chitinibacter sp. GC72]|uniref:DUF2946 family protein n=1 Tax=Chitinibacter sp. GC72 TaxID=1526917 RepID=UPI0012FC197A|nr:DUF2946 family protein [Chitinibacter sp. GC72]
MRPRGFPALFLPRRATLASWLALLAIVAQLLLPFVHAAAMDAGVKMAWCGTGPVPAALNGNVLTPDTDLLEIAEMAVLASERGDAKLIVKCALCSVAGLHAIAPLQAPVSLPLLAPLQHAPPPWQQAFVSPLSFSTPPPPRGPPLIS